MTQEETKSRNTSLATYMEWEQVNHPDTGEILSRNQGLMMYKDYFLRNPPFHEDMNLLMPVVWKLMADQGYQFVMDLEKCLVVGGRGSRLHKWVDVGESPAHALWEAVSSLVMELQQKAV